MTFTWSVPPSQAFTQMYDAFSRAIYYAILKSLDRRAPEIENWMKASARWEDRTGNARASLACVIVPELKRIIILFSLGRLPNGAILDYTKWLELAMGGRYSIIAPAVEAWAPVLLQDAKALIQGGSPGVPPAPLGGAAAGRGGLRRDMVNRGIRWYRKAGKPVPKRYKKWAKELRQAKAKKK